MPSTVPGQRRHIEPVASQDQSQASFAPMSRTPITAATPQTIANAARALRDGGLVAFPTETVYGLGADATNGLAVAKIFAAKGRPQFNPLIVHFASIQAARAHVIFSPAAKVLANAFWPGPLTLVLQRGSDQISELVSAGLPTLAIRVPSHAIAQSLLQQASIPIAAPSANRSGHVSATTAAHVADDLAHDVDMILNCGPTQHGLESTILDATGDEISILRPGTITQEQLQAVLGSPVSARATTQHTQLTAPGQLDSHYAPQTPLRLNAQTVNPGEALLAFGPPLAYHAAMIQLSESRDLVEAASRLFQALRDLDKTQATIAAVMPIPNVGLGVAINDRLRRAAAPRR